MKYVVYSLFDDEEHEFDSFEEAQDWACEQPNSNDYAIEPKDVAEWDDEDYEVLGDDEDHYN